jgi:pimeloyl-ACP methyl ester carboxylesterase
MPYVFIHGAGRQYLILEHWANWLNATLLRLPGHSCPRSQPTVAAFAEALAGQVPAGSIVVGESLGGLVALQLSRLVPLAGVVAVDPPLNTLKNWTLRALLDYYPPADPWNAEFLGEVFGIYPDRLEDRDYWPLTAAAAAPTAYITGDEALSKGAPFERAPCMLDEGDVTRLRERFPVRVIPQCGHMALHYEPVACLHILRGYEELWTNSRPGG